MVFKYHIIYYSCCQVTGVLAVCANALYILHVQNLALCQPLFAVDSHLCQHISCNILIIIAHYCILVITCYLLLIGHYILFHCRLMPVFLGCQCCANTVFVSRQLSHNPQHFEPQSGDADSLTTYAASPIALCVDAWYYGYDLAALRAPVIDTDTPQS